MRDEARTTSAVLDLLDAVYEAPFDPRWWQRVGELMVPLFQADTAVLMSHDLRHGSTQFAFAQGLPRSNWRAYGEHFQKLDHDAASARGPQRNRRDNGAGSYQPGRAPFQSNSFYNDFWHGVGDWFHTLGGFAPVGDHVVGNLGLPRRAGRQPYTAEALALLDRVSPHVHRALRLSRQFARAHFTETVAHALPQSQSLAAWVVDESRRVVFANARGEELLRLADGFALKKGRLAAAVAADQEPVDMALHEALRDPDPSDSGPPPEFTLRRARARAPLRVAISRAPVQMLAWLGRGARGALVIAHVPEAPATISPRAVQKVLALTQAEARVVAALASGMNPRDISERFQVSLETVRAQIKSSMRRLDCHRQAELIAKTLAALGRTNEG